MSNQAEETSCSSYRVAIHLNNVGVSLLQRKAYRQALDTLKDAVSVIRSTFAGEDDEHEARRDLMLARAARRLASPKSLVCSSQLVTISDDGGVTAINSFPSVNQRDRTVYAVAIEHFCLDERDVDVDSAIILHNFALSHLLLSRVAKVERYAQQLRLGAQKVSALAYRTLSAMMVARNERELEDLVILNPTLFLTAVSVLHSMVQILVESELPSRARQSSQRLSMLKAAIKDFEEPSVGSQVAAAA